MKVMWLLAGLSLVGGWAATGAPILDLHGAVKDCAPASRWDASATLGGDVAEVRGATTSGGSGCRNESRQPSAPATSLPSTIVTSSDACTPGGVTGIANIALTCFGQANRDLQSCDPTLGFEISPTTVQTLQPDGTYSAPQLNSVLACNAALSAPVVLTQADFRALPLTPTTIVVGPPQGWVPVTMDTIVYADPTPQTLTTTLLGQTVLVRATPTEYTWDFADSSPTLTTTDPGAPWPNHSLAHPYTRTGTYTVTMTTTWTGDYSLDAGATFSPITGTATTTSTAPPLTVTELRSHLVDQPLH